MAGASTTIFVGTQYLRENSIINDNVDAKVLQPIIRMAQDKYIQQTIGTSLYNKMIQLVDAAAPVLVTPAVGVIGQPGYVPPVYTSSLTPITGNYKILLEDYIIPTLVQYAVWESVPFMNFKFRNKSISKQSSDNATPADLTELYYIRDNVLTTAQFYAERMSTYLCQNTTLFPEYTAFSGDLSPNSNNSFTGIHIPRRRRNQHGTYGWLGNNDTYGGYEHNG